MSFTFKKENGTVKGDFSKLNKLVEGLSKKTYVDVGILGESNETKDEEITLAGIMAVHEFGSTKRSIPARSWLRMPLETGSEDIEKTVRPKVEKLLEEGDIEGVFNLLGVACEARIQKGFDTGGFGDWDPLQPETIRRKGSDAILIDTGAARQAVTSKVGGVK